MHRERDAGLYQAVVKQLSIEGSGELLDLTLSLTHTAERPEERIRVRVGHKEYDGLDAQEVMKRFQTSRSILFHNSTQTTPPTRFSGGFGHLREISAEDRDLMERMKRTVNKGLSRIARGRQRELAELLGRLERKYNVGLSLPTFDFNYMPYNINLGEAKPDVPLDDWGSGTRNRTLMLVLLFTAKQISEAEASAAKVTPVIVLEEPESFLHPSAQAEFGRVLHDLAAEFDVQVIVTTHSPYMLSVDNSEANILLRRRLHYNHLRETERVNTVGEAWMEPFAQALGLESEEFRPWKELFLAPTDSILLVEGPTDKGYFEMLRDPAHGANQLKFAGEVLSYDGTGALRNNVFLRLIKNRYKRMFVTYDLDQEKHIEKNIKMLGLEKSKAYCPIGVNAPGRRCIEGLLPESVTTAVFKAHPELVHAATAGTADERDAAKNELKKLYVVEFRRQASPGEEFFGGFYPIVKMINRAFS